MGVVNDTNSTAQNIPSETITIKEKCSRYFINNIEEFCLSEVDSYEKNVPIEATLGDMVIFGEKTLRSMNVFFINCVPVDNKSNDIEESDKMVRKLVQKDPTGSGNCCVPLEVTSKIKNPIKFYENAFNFDSYDEVDFSGIEIDTEVHQDVIKTFTGGKEVAKNRKCMYFFSYNEWDSSSGMFIWVDFFLDDFGNGRYLKLKPDIDPLYLIESPPKIRDPQVELNSIEIKKKYEEVFTNSFLHMDKGKEVDVYGLTFFYPNNNDNGGCVFTMSFNRVETEGDEIAKIVLNRKENNESDETMSGDQQEFVFEKKVFTEYGRFGNVSLWSIENAGIITNDDLNTYIICPAELFF